MQRFLLPAMIALTVLGGPAVALIARAPEEGGPVLVVAANPDASIRGAGGRPFGPGRAPLGSLATSNDPEFAQRLRESGAWLVLDGRILSAICGAGS
jgi:hypothetical protein